MFNIIYVIIFVFVDLTSVADIIRPFEVKVMPLKIGDTGTMTCDLMESNSDVRLVQWYKSRNIDAFEGGDPSVAWWAEGESGSLPNYHMENTTFSLVIGMATLEDEGLYKCSMVCGSFFTESVYYIRTVMYALPRIDPEITLNTDLNRVDCTVEHVWPLLYPMLNLDWIPDSTETYAVLNEDGTYTTSVCCALPQTNSASRVYCSFSYLHYKARSSLDLRDITTDSLIEKEKTTVSPMGASVTSAGNGCRTIHHTPFIDWTIYIGLILTRFKLLNV